ncbi:hypothetical protein ACIQPQ_11500 [Streptomyces sp. NPDC091281]|uniref:hypothetical protein n=1 Tax=Streptomyces sp. NPDC091281 TaxID=3365985 RepID=UPI0037F44C9A
MLIETANGISRTAVTPFTPFTSFWPRVREFAVPPSMIETATARRLAGDWAGACAAAGFDVDLRLRTVARTHGTDLVARVRSDLRRLAPDLLRWHMPRIAPDGLLRPGLTLTLARYDAAGRDGVRPVHLVARTAPAWADAGQRISLTLWDASQPDAAPGATAGVDDPPHRPPRQHAPPHSYPAPHPHPRPNRRFRLDLHRHLWDAGRAHEFPTRAGADLPDEADSAALPVAVPEGGRCAVARWADEARILLAADGRPPDTPVLVRLGGARRVVLDPAEGAAALLDPDAGTTGSAGTVEAAGPTEAAVRLRSVSRSAAAALPVLPDAATWVAPDLELLRGGAIDADRLHPLVAAALVPGYVPGGPSAGPDDPGRPRLVECRGARHRIGLVDGVLAALDHPPDEIRREGLLVALTGSPLPCLRAIDDAHRRPECLTGVRERLQHGDVAGALAVVEGLLGPEALLRDGPLRDALEATARQRLTYGLFRSGLTGPGRAGLHDRPPPRTGRSRPRNATTR